MWLWSERLTDSGHVQPWGKLPRRLAYRQLRFANWSNGCRIFAGFGSSDSEKNDPFGQLEAANPRFSKIFEHATALLRQPRHLSMHPGRDRCITGFDDRYCACNALRQEGHYHHTNGSGCRRTVRIGEN